jgi:hypothetical protein
MNGFLCSIVYRLIHRTGTRRKKVDGFTLVCVRAFICICMYEYYICVCMLYAWYMYVYVHIVEPG